MAIPLSPPFSTPRLLDALPDLALQRLGEEEEAGLWLTSLPWPRAPFQELSLSGQPTYCAPLGQWPGEPAGTPRRLLLATDGKNCAPGELNLQAPESPLHGPPSATLHRFAQSPNPLAFWENHLLQLNWGGHKIGIALGLRHGNEFHWWEGCNLITLRENAHCLEVEMGGAIPLIPNDASQLNEYPRIYDNPLLHKHNWLNGHLYARLHSNGVCEIYAHHINSKFYDDGLDLPGVVPVIGFALGQDEEFEEELLGTWDGSRTHFSVGQAKLDVTEAARLATPEQPGQMTRSGNFLVWQPYRGAELYSGVATKILTGDPYLCHAEDEIVLRGMARTVRFSLSLSDRSPKVATYLAPAWWYGLCEEFSPVPLLPETGAFDADVRQMTDWVQRNVRKGGFEDGWMPLSEVPPGREGDKAYADSSWKGDLPYALLLNAYRTCGRRDYENALRLSYHFTDVAVDHAMLAVRMQGFQPPAVSPTLNRMQASIMAYYELGDPYLLRTARGVLDTTYATHLNSWPRMATGRDGCFINGAVLLYRYSGDEHYRELAYHAALAIAQTQRPEGSFGDQGGGSGIHNLAAYITKPWMALLATSGLIDYLELFPDSPPLLSTVKNLADWLMANRIEFPKGRSWTYQHEYNGRREFTQEEKANLVCRPSDNPWHHESLGRLLGYCSLRFNEPAYYEAYLESRGVQPTGANDYTVYALLYCLPWLQDRGLSSAINAERD